MITSATTLFPNKVEFTGLGGSGLEGVFWGTGFNPTQVREWGECCRDTGRLPKDDLQRGRTLGKDPAVPTSPLASSTCGDPASQDGVTERALAARPCHGKCHWGRGPEGALGRPQLSFK